MSKRKSKKSKNTTLIVFLVITFIIAIALLLYFFLWKENYGEIRENMSEEGEGKGYEQQCMDADNYRCKENLTCANKNEQGKGTCKCESNKTHTSKLTDEQKKFFKDECISNTNLDVYNKDLGTKDGCDFISGVWDGSKCLPPGSKICKNNETRFSKLTDEQKPFFNEGECIPQNVLVDLGKQEGCERIFSGVWDGSKCLPPGTKIASKHSCYILKGKYDDCKECCRSHVGAGRGDSILLMSSGSYNPTFAQCVKDICLD